MDEIHRHDRDRLRADGLRKLIDKSHGTDRQRLELQLKNMTKKAGVDNHPRHG